MGSDLYRKPSLLPLFPRLQSVSLALQVKLISATTDLCGIMYFPANYDKT
jgi:hypothetical protein